MSRFKTYRQHDSMECGITCLRMVCKHYGAEYSSEYLSRLCFATNEGVSLLVMCEAAEKLGLQSVCGKLTIEQLATVPLPCILHWNQNHFVVLHRISRNGRRFHIADPGKGQVTRSLRDMEEHWVSTSAKGSDRGVAMIMETTPAFYERMRLSSDEGESRSFRFLAGYLKKYRKHFVQIAVGLALGCLLQLVLPFLTQAIVDVGIKNHDIGFVWLVLLGQLMLTVSRTALDFIRRWLLLHISMRVNISLVSDFFIKLLKLPMSFFDTKLMGDLMQRMNDHARVNSFLTGQTLGVAFSLLSLVVFGVVLLMYNVMIFTIFMVGSAVYALWIAAFLRRRKVLDYELFEQQAINTNKTYEFITSMQEIKLQDCRRRRWEWEDTQADLFNVQMRSLKLQQTEEAGSIFINELKNIVITVVSATAVIHGELTLGMMLGYYPVSEGCIAIGGTDIAGLNLDEWRRRCGVVMQNGVIFSESIARNIAVDDGDIDKERMVNAAETACIKDYIMSLPLKFDTNIGRDGTGLSQGQKQRILIARAVYKNPDFIFLDEATNSLDANNERKIVENLDRFCKDRTVIIVAHRLSTVRNADNIIVIDKGRVAETGTHETLTRQKGLYYELVKNQLELGN